MQALTDRQTTSAMDYFVPRNYRAIFMRVLSDVLGLIFAVQVFFALSTGHVTLMRTGLREVFRAKTPVFFWMNVGVSAGCAVVLLYACFKRGRNSDP